jgi:membrane-associated phospholipid phosphatase
MRTQAHPFTSTVIRFAVVLCLGTMLITPAAKSQTNLSDPYRFWKWPVQDAAAIVKGIASDDAFVALGGGAVLLLTARHDAEITADLSNFDHGSADLLVRVVEEIGNVKSIRPLAGVIFLGSLMTDDDYFQDAAFTSLEAVVMANILTSGLKSAFGRARPFQNQGALEFSPFSGNTSFPSGHSTTAFAFITPWLLYYPNAFTPGLLVLGAGTAFTRLLTDNHWFTDIVAGSAIGFATAYVLTNRHRGDNQRVMVAPSLGLEHVGVTVAVRMP